MGGLLPVEFKAVGLRSAQPTQQEPLSHRGAFGLANTCLQKEEVTAKLNCRFTMRFVPLSQFQVV